MTEPTAESGGVSLKALAAELGIDRSRARKYVLNLGITPIKRRTPDLGGQLTLAVSASEAALIRRTRAELDFSGSQRPVKNEIAPHWLMRLFGAEAAILQLASDGLQVVTKNNDKYLGPVDI